MSVLSSRSNETETSVVLTELPNVTLSPAEVELNAIYEEVTRSLPGQSDSFYIGIGAGLVQACDFEADLFDEEAFMEDVEESGWVDVSDVEEGMDSVIIVPEQLKDRFCDAQQALMEEYGH